MIQLPAIINEVAWLLVIEYDSNGTTAAYRWTSTDYPITAPNGDVYTSNNAVAEISDFTLSGSRVERRSWNVILADPEHIYGTVFQNNWLRKRCWLYSYTNPGANIIHWKTGYCIGVQRVTTVEKGHQVQLQYADLLGRISSTKRRLTNNDAQQEVDNTDDSMLHAQDTLDINWGGN